MKNSRLIEINIDEIDWNKFVHDHAQHEVKDYLKNKKHMKIERYEEYDVNGDPIEIGKQWKDVILDISKINRIKFSDKPKIQFCDISQIVKFNSSHDAYLNVYSDVIFYAYSYQNINGHQPNVFRFEEFTVSTFVKGLFKHYDVPSHSYSKVSYQTKSEASISSMLIGFKYDLFIYIDGVNSGAIYYNPSYEEDKSSLLYTILGLLKATKQPKVTKNKIFIVYRSAHGFAKTGFNVNKRSINLNENYNDDFEEVSTKIIEGLNDKKKTNLVILSGDPGTGKTSFVRYIVPRIKKNVIFISPDMVESITDPSFIPFLMDNNDSVLVIEDAEPALEKRNAGGRSSAVSNVLNLTDGLLSDCLKISILATFNTSEKNIDSALTRKGRLLMNYKFDKLSKEKSQALLKKLGHNVEVKEPMTLADIYFYGKNNNNDGFKTKKIGF